MSTLDRAASRRKFLQFVCASPLLAAGDGTAIAQALLPKARQADPLMWAPLEPQHLIKTPKEAINVFDFELACRQNVAPAHFGYMASGIDDDVTLRANREGFGKFQLRPRRLVDVSKIDMSTEILGVRYDTPIALSPVGGHRMFHDDGELAVARAAKAGNHMQIVATGMTYPIEQIAAARGAPIWFQLYASNKWDVARTFVMRAQNAGCPVVAVTVDRSGGRNQEALLRLRRTDPRNCADCHDNSTMESTRRRRSMFEGVDLSGLTHTQSSAMTWDFLKRLRETTRMKIVLKGILAHEDAVIAVKSGMDGIIVSNHGGRGEDSGRSTIDALPEILEAVQGRIPVLIDSGFRRGTDIVKALCMGAQAVCIGRPYIWGLGAFGQPGVERVLELLRIELRAAMQQMGAPTVKQLVPAMVRRSSL